MWGGLGLLRLHRRSLLLFLLPCPAPLSRTMPPSARAARADTSKLTAPGTQYYPIGCLCRSRCAKRPMVARHLLQGPPTSLLQRAPARHQNLRAGEPVILVANHAGAFGPVSVITSMPVEMHPWVAHEVTDLRTVAPRIQAEFCEQELHLKPPLSVFLATVIGAVCVALMKDIGAIPVYQKSKRITATVMRACPPPAGQEHPRLRRGLHADDQRSPVRVLHGLHPRRQAVLRDRPARPSSSSPWP